MSFIKKCRICDAPLEKPFFDLGKHPLANSLLRSSNEREQYYPLALVRCASCSLIQLTYTVPPKKLFSHYVWVTGTSKTARDFSYTFYEELVARTYDAKKGYVLEVACNDGTFLKPFMRAGYNVFGVDPAKNIVEIAQKDGVSSQCLFWGYKEAKTIQKNRGKARMIFARNVLAHVADPVDFVKGLAYCLDDDGTLAIEVHYAAGVIQGLQYDSIYHEHLCYFTLRSLSHLMSKCGLRIFDVLDSPIGGSGLIIYAQKRKKKESPRVQKRRAWEAKHKINTITTWMRFAHRCAIHRDKITNLLHKALTMGTVIGWGASARSSTLLNYCKIGPTSIQCIADLNPLKQGLYTAGTHIQIAAPDAAMKMNPACVVILGWNFTHEIKEILRKQYRYSNAYLIPLPTTPRLIKHLT